MVDDKVYSGIVIFFSNKLGYGFLQWEKDGAPQKDIFLHHSCINSEGFRTLQKDQRVNFKIGENNRGQIIATSVTIIK